MRPDDFDVHKIIETCQGSCMETLQSALDFHYPEMSEDELTKEDHNTIDNEIFVCETCGWWCEVGQSKGDNGNCEDCEEEDDE